MGVPMRAGTFLFYKLLSEFYLFDLKELIMSSFTDLDAYGRYQGENNPVVSLGDVLHEVFPV